MKKVLIIDPVVSSKYLGKSLSQLGLYTVALFTCTEESLPEYYRPAPKSFNEVIFCNDPFNKYLSNISADFIINGSDSSLQIADMLSTKLTTKYANNPATSKYRSNKHLMHLELAKNNLNYV